jgi:hypothetical protein
VTFALDLERLARFEHLVEEPVDVGSELRCADGHVDLHTDKA